MMIDWRSAMLDAEYRRNRRLEEIRRNREYDRELEYVKTEERVEAENPPVLGVLVAAFASLLVAGVITVR